MTTLVNAREAGISVVAIPDVGEFFRKIPLCETFLCEGFKKRPKTLDTNLHLEIILLPEFYKSL